MSGLYEISLKDWRRASSKTLRENERAYESLKDKTTLYAKEIKALQDLHRKVNEIYKNAPKDI